MSSRAIHWLRSNLFYSVPSSLATLVLLYLAWKLLPPFFGGLMAYDSEATITFACPGHQGGQFYRKSPAGQLFFKHLGESVFRNDLCNADVDLGDLLIHEGLSVGTSSGINVAAAVRVAKALGPGHTVVTILADGGSRYQSKLFNLEFLRSKGLPTPGWMS